MKLKLKESVKLGVCSAEQAAAELLSRAAEAGNAELTRVRGSKTYRWLLARFAPSKEGEK